MNLKVGDYVIRKSQEFGIDIMKLIELPDGPIGYYSFQQITNYRDARKGGEYRCSEKNLSIYRLLDGDEELKAELL
jgi:hypothetical protein